MSNIKNQKELNELLKQRRKLLKDIEEAEKVNTKANYDKKSVLEDIAKIENELVTIKKQNENFTRLEKNQTKEKKEQAAAGRKTLNIEKQLNKLKKTSQGSILKEVNLLKSLEKTSKAAQDTTGKTQQAFNLASQAQLQALEDIKAGTFDALHFQFVGTPGLPEEHPPYDIWCTNDGEYLFLKGAVGGYMQTYYELVELSKS